jgi:alpha-methylacyl-CoA racemase
MPGPLAGLKVIEFAGQGPAPFCGMLLADMGADVIRITRPGEPPYAPHDVLIRGRASHLEVDLKTSDGAAQLLALIDKADALIEGFRPGVMERLGLSPQVCLARNPRLVFGRVTGWGQDGPLSAKAGHDINYIALSGALASIGPAGGDPAPPLNLVGDFGGGGMLLAVGLLCALLDSRQSGRGQVVDASMLDGASLLMASVFGFRSAGLWPGERGDNTLDGGAPFYRCYRCLDGRWLAVGAIESGFYAQLLAALGLTTDEQHAALGRQWERAHWESQASLLATIFATRTRDDWCTHFDPIDACVSPVLELDEVTRHPHNLARATFIELAGVLQPGRAPRFSRPSAEPAN